jgi:hypothetical protein
MGPLGSARMHHLGHSSANLKNPIEQLGVSQVMPHTVSEYFIIPVSFAHMLSVWFLQFAVSQTRRLFLMTVFINVCITAFESG